ncbi:hypothetical protein [Streptomyces sp. CFMR 7]|uniref:hypothetical protein n=1 Tax=Streptomyces sp. CFMR 7 TaxID=1649184 RepID=UPI0006AD36C6|nr:hypothetical protein [Streptomyces sp. CFMR 7]ALC32348.1 hypothetical protein ABE83_34955 [Streptomyces sp. CFMR 7]
MDTVSTARRIVLGPVPALLAAALFTGCVTVPAGTPGPRPARTSAPTSPAPVPGAVPGRDVQPAGGTDVLVRIEADHPEHEHLRTSPPQPAAAPQRRTTAPAARPAPLRAQPQPQRPVPRPAVRPLTPAPIPQMRALCRRAGGGVVPPTLAQLCHQTYGR